MANVKAGPPRFDGALTPRKRFRLLALPYV